jgi:hypothetical protein
VGDVEALDAAGELFEGEGILESFGDGLLRGDEDAEALVVRLLGVLADKVDEGTLFAALRDGDVHAVTTLFRERIGEKLAVGEIDGDEDGAGDVTLIEVDLFEESGEEGSG